MATDERHVVSHLRLLGYFRCLHRRNSASRPRVQQLRSDMVQRTAGMLTAASMEAVKTLLELQKAPVPAAVRLGATRSVIELGTKLRETAEFEERLAALEQQVAPREQA